MFHILHSWVDSPKPEPLKGKGVAHNTGILRWGSAKPANPGTVRGFPGTEEGISPNYGYLSGSPCNKGYSVLGYFGGSF